MIAPLLNLPATLPQSLAAQSSESHWDTAQSLLLDPFGLDKTKLDTVLARMQGPGVDAADLYFQYTRHEAWGLEEGIVKNGSFSIDQGVGVRACSGDKTAFAYADAIFLENLENAADVVKSIGSDVQNRHVHVDAKKTKTSAGKSHAHSPLYLANDPIASLDSAAKVRILQSVDQLARAADPRIVQVMASLSAAYDVVLVARENGLRAADVRPLVRLSVSVIAQQGQRKESGSSGGGGRFDLGYFDEMVLQTYVRQAVHSALTNLEARPAPAGEMPVVLGSGWPGVMLHEAVGHGLEGDFNRKGSSAFSGKIGQRVAAKGVTVLDDGTLPGRRGSLSMDDEGHPSQSNTLIEDGILLSYMQDSLNARLMGMPQSGNGRRESYAHLPMPRMTNTYMLGGDTPAEEIIASLDKGLYAVNFGGGQVDITSGQFVFSASEAYWVENGKIQYPVKGATLIGNGPQALQKIKLIGDDLALDGGIGVCGKDGQSVPVGVGQPTLRIDGLVVGGTA